MTGDPHLDPRRPFNVGASECAALWSLGWESRYRLWARKSGKLPHDGEDEQLHMTLGRYMEPAAAAYIQDKRGLTLRKVRKYTLHKQVIGMACSLDYEIVSHPKGPGVLELKFVDAGVFAGWEGQPPLQYELQVQHQLACTGREWGILAVMVSNRKVELFERERHPDTIAKIEAEVPVFWGQVTSGEEPPYGDDNESLIQAMRQVAPGKVCDLSMDADAQEDADLYHHLGERLKFHQVARDAAKARLLRKIGDAEEVFLPSGRIKTWEVGPAEFVMKRSAYRGFRVTVQEKEAASSAGAATAT